MDINSTGNQTIWDETGTYPVSVNSDNEILGKAKLWDGTDVALVDDDRLLVQTKSKGQQIVENGDHYFLEGYTSLDVNETMEWVVTTPTTTPLVHMLFYVSSSAGFEIDIYEGSTSVVGGTSKTPINLNRGSTNTSDTTIILDPTSITDGTLLFEHKYGGLKETGFINADEELILKPNTAF